MLLEGIFYYIIFCFGEKKNIIYIYVVVVVLGYLMFFLMKFLMLIV